MAHADDGVAAGDRIAGRYQVEATLGRGGMAAVYRVRDQRSGKPCALKRAGSSDARKARRRGVLLEREYHTLAQLAHPRIIEVYEYGVDERGPYYTMELLEGADLDQGGRLPWKQACALLYDVASSLGILHARGLIHRDVSLRNVRCTPEGRAKLIDFGAMTSMGVARDLVGTPPFVAPEVLQMQELDARADLFSLGAIGYYLLTGRNAYPARRLSELRDVWRSRPMPAARLVPELPPALSALIDELLSLDRGARPRSAAEVMERLCALAGLPREERIEVSRAYLTTPALVGRDKALVRARRQILSLARRDGGTLLIEGVAGSGRSRMLDACVLEGKLLGATVVRADAGDGARADWEVARALCAQLVELMPEEAAEAARLTRDVLAHVVEGLASEGSVSAILPERSLLLRSLRDFVLSLSRSQRLLLAVDDVDKIDEPSAALLAAIAHKSEKHAVLLALSTESARGPGVPVSLRLLRMVAESIELEQLSSDETLGLTRSLFGDVPNVQLLAGKIHALAHGNPRATLDLVQHLRERGLARYEAGSWLLPAQIDESDLPKTLADALATRLQALSEDARTLLCVLCLADGDALTLADYSELTRFGEGRHVFAALDELVAARILIADGARYRFTQRGFLPILHQRMADERRRAVHAMLADFLGRSGGDLLRRAHHLLQADRGREAVELLCSVNLQARLPPVALLEQAIEQAERLGLPPRTIHRLQMALMSKASVVLSAGSFRKYLPKVLAQLEHDCGLALYRELSALPESVRLKQALARTHERYLATPEAERVHAITDAIRELARLAGALCSFAMQLHELETLESLPSLAPLVPLSPALAVIVKVVEACKHWSEGRSLRHRQLAHEVLARIAEPDLGGLDEMQQERTRLGLHYAIGLFEASCGVSEVEQRAKVLEGAREHRVNAWRLRMLLHLNQGNADEARRCERRAELLQLQETSEQRYLGMGSASEIIALAEIGDLVATKHCVEILAGLAESYPNWRPYLAYGQCRYRWLQGDLQGALDALLPAFELARPLRHNAFPCLAGAHVRLLVELGRIGDAVAHGRAYLELLEREQIIALDHGVHVGLAQALAAAGEQAEAVRVIEGAIDGGERLGCAGLALGVLYETRARIAIGIGDGEAFERFAGRCAKEYNKARNPALSARFARLLEAARLREIAAAEPAAEIRALLDLPAVVASETGVNSVHSRILECLDPSDRARCALTLLLQSTDSACGYLYGLRDGQLALLAALPESAGDDRITDWLMDCVHAELNADENATAENDADATRSEIAVRYTDAEGRLLEPVFLFAAQERPIRLAAVLAIHVQAGPRTLPPRLLLEELAHELLEHGDVTGMRASEAVTRDES